MDSSLPRYQYPQGDLVERISISNSQALHDITKHMRTDKETEDAAELDPDDIDNDEEYFAHRLAGPGAVVVDGKTVPVHKWLGDNSTNAIVCWP